MTSRVFPALVAMLLAFPVTIVAYGDTGIVLADLVSLLGAVWFLKRVLTVEGFLVSLAILSSLVISLVAWLAESTFTLRPIGSMVFFFKPVFAYFLAFAYVRDGSDVDRFAGCFSLFSSLLLASVIASVAVLYGSVLRTESALNGSFFGLPILGSYGVNSLAVFYALCSFIALYAAFSETQWWLAALHAAVSAGFALLTFGSQSREAVLGLLVMSMALVLLLVPRRPIPALTLIAAGATAAVSVLPALLASDLLAVKVDQFVQGVAARDWDAVSSGRLSLYLAALSDIVSNPLAGVSFRGFAENAIALPYISEVAGLSPHNQYITAVWKTGLIPAFIYFAAIASMVVRALRIRTAVARRWAVAFLLGVFLVFANLWDVLIVPNVGALIFFVLGLLAAGSERGHVGFDDRIHGR